MSAEKVSFKDGDYVGPDALFFYQLVLPLGDVQRSNIPNDPRMSYYSEVQRFTNIYMAESGINTEYGHNVRVPSIAEHVRFDGVLFRGGLTAQGDGALYRFWKGNGPGTDPLVQASLTM